jgi:hypothetical protein
MKRLRFSQEELSFLKENYPVLGRRECAKRLGRSLSSVKTKVLNMGYQCSPTQSLARQRCPKKLAGEYNINEDLFINSINPTTAYLLGLLWADGNLGGDRHLRLRLQLIEEDALIVEKQIDKTGKWSKSPITDKRNGHRHLGFVCSNPILCNFLKNYNYLNKSYASPDAMLERIPESLRRYFYLGYLDGDGCIHVGVKNNFCIVFTSTIQQDWTFLEKLATTLEIPYHIERRIRKNRNSKFSSFRIGGYRACYKFGDYLYANSQRVFLPRKYKKFLSIKKKYLSSHSNSNF